MRVGERDIPGGTSAPEVAGGGVDEPPSPGSGRRPLVSWDRPTRGYLACSVEVATVGLASVVAWQVWLLVRGDPVRWGWSVWSLACAAVAAVVLVELGRRPRPQAYKPRDGRREPRAGNAAERRAVRRAVRSVIPPPERRLALIAARRFTNVAGNWPLTVLNLFAASVFAARAAASPTVDGWAGLIWGLVGVVLVAVTLKARRLTARLERAWQTTTNEPAPASVAGAIEEER